MTVRMESMAVTVTCRVPINVRTTYVTYKVEYVRTANMGYMVATVINRVPQTVKTTRVIYKVEHAFHVNSDGLE